MIIDQYKNCVSHRFNPTLLDMTGLKSDSKLEGKSLVKLLKNPSAEWPHLARTSFGVGNISIRSERYRYIHYNDGTEEFYDHSKDAHEWNNLIKRPEMAELVKNHRAALPKKFHPILGKRSTGHQPSEASEAAAKK
jgi:arylsulfatase A-like enzyme